MRRRLGLLLILSAFALMLIAAWLKLNPIVREIAVSEAKNNVTTVINNAVTALLNEGELDYSDIINLEKDENGAITALVTDMGHVNALKAEATQRIIVQMASPFMSEISIPAGNLFGETILSGKGPQIPISIISVGSIDTDFANHFQSAGINQTRHQIMIMVKVNVNVLTPGGTVTTEVNTHIAVAETVIVGSVPDNYMYFESDENWDNALEQYDILT